jgi:hypothetical protein
MKFELENDVVDEIELLDFDENEANEIYKAKPWKRVSSYIRFF